MNELIHARIYKVDEQSRTVTGRATQEMLDRDSEIFDYASSKPNFMAWSASVSADTNGMSLGNIRAMHGSVAAGILKAITFNDHEKAIDVEAHITDDQEWRKVLSGTYSGFSIGGRYTRKWPVVENGKMVHRYTADPAEISIVDRPCVPAAKFFTVQKSDGRREHVSFRGTARYSLNVFKQVLARPSGIWGPDTLANLKKRQDTQIQASQLPMVMDPGYGAPIADTGATNQWIDPLPVARLSPLARQPDTQNSLGTSSPESAARTTESGQQDVSIQAIKAALRRPQRTLKGNSLTIPE